MKALIAITLLLATSLVGCGEFVARDADTYRKDTKDLLATKNAAIKGCYDSQLKADPKVNGKVVINFTVQEETGQIINAALDTAKTTAPEALSKCVMDAVSGLTLDPPDQREGVATFVWEFAVKS